jgi:inner membrane protein
MLLFGHAGITLGAALLAAAAIGRKRTFVSWGRSSAGPLRSVTSAVDRLSRYADIRWILIGALLPDIIDKPLGLLFLSNGRVFSHSLAFLGLLCVVGAALYGLKGRTWMFALAFGTLFHLVLDFMWQTPDVLFWPGYGVSFAVVDESGWWGRLWQAFLRAPGVSIPEVLGFAVCILFVVIMARRRMFWDWVKWGRTA